jgi:hypothetical protein
VPITPTQQTTKHRLIAQCKAYHVADHALLALPVLAHAIGGLDHRLLHLTREKILRALLAPRSMPCPAVTYPLAIFSSRLPRLDWTHTRAPLAALDIRAIMVT